MRLLEIIEGEDDNDKSSCTVVNMDLVTRIELYNGEHDPEGPRVTFYFTDGTTREFRNVYEYDQVKATLWRYIAWVGMNDDQIDSLWNMKGRVPR